MKISFANVAGRRLYRVEVDGTTRSNPAPQTLAAIREAIQQERDRHQQFQRDESAAQDVVRTCVLCGTSSAEARAAVAHFQDAIAESVGRVADLEALADEVRSDAAEIYARDLRQQHDAAMAVTVAALPPIPELEA